MYRYWLRPGKDLKKYGQWAIVTGATDGIGKAYAFELAKKGMSVLLLSRTESKLQAVEQELKKEYPNVEIDHLAIDFSKFDAQAREAAQNKINPLDVGILINNVGMNHGNIYFHESTIEQDIESVETNVNGTVFTTKLVLGTEQGPGMIKRKRGAIVTTGSLTSRMPASPLLLIYGATKKFVEHFSATLRAELADFNIDVNCQVPNMVSTKLNAFSARDCYTPLPDKYARSCVAHIGYEDLCAPFWIHAWQIYWMRSAPDSLVIKGALGNNLAVRKAVQEATPEQLEAHFELQAKEYRKDQALLADKA